LKKAFKMRNLLNQSAERSIHYLENQGSRSVYPSPQALEQLARLDIPLPHEPTPPEQVLALLDEIGSPATVTSTGGRYFGFVTGGTLPAALAANWLASAWDQPADMVIASPIGARIEQIAMRWLLDVLSLPADSGVGFVTGATMANFAGLAAARHAILDKLGWDVEARGLFGAPEITVVASDQVHVSLLKALSLLGLGRERLIRVHTDDQGRIIPTELPELNPTTIVCLLAGNVNSGAFDPAADICAVAQSADAWVHVDGAFGLWAAAAPARAYLTSAYDQADSWVIDAHKWLNVPYDSGMVICRSEEYLRAAMSYGADYLVQGSEREPGQYTPEMSRRARGIEVWAALLSLGRAGLADLIERSCRYAARFAQVLSKAGYSILNDVVLNQVLVSFGDDETIHRVIAALQADGTCWCGGTLWHGQPAMRISVSSWATTEQDVEQSLQAILRIAAQEAQ
jgi:glutamate/tyrosine decarboxylase-like PLP-dependent enzyme